MNRLIILVGEGINQHTLYGDFKFQENKNVSTQDALHGVLEIEEDSELRHESPNREFAEHKTLRIDKGRWVTARQVEYNPLTKEISRVWD